MTTYPPQPQEPAPVPPSEVTLGALLQLVDLMHRGQAAELAREYASQRHSETHPQEHPGRHRGIRITLYAGDRLPVLSADSDMLHTLTRYMGADERTPIDLLSPAAPGMTVPRDGFIQLHCAPVWLDDVIPDADDVDEDPEEDTPRATPADFVAGLARRLGLFDPPSVLPPAQ